MEDEAVVPVIGVDRPGPSSLRSAETCPWRALSAVFGGSSPQSASMIRSGERRSFACRTMNARTARAFARRGVTSRSSSRISSGPRILTSKRGPPSLEPILAGRSRRVTAALPAARSLPRMVEPRAATTAIPSGGTHAGAPFAVSTIGRRGSPTSWPPVDRTSRSRPSSQSASGMSRPRLGVLFGKLHLGSRTELHCSPPTWRRTGRRGQAVALIGRAAGVAAVAEALRQGRLVAVVGEAGIGKTSVVRAAAAQAGRRLHEGGGFATLSWLPYLAIRRAVELGDAGEPEQVADTVRRAVGAGTLFLDDLHWVDESSRAVLDCWTTASASP